MKKTWHKSIISIVLTVAILVGSLPMTAFAAVESLREVDFLRPSANITANSTTYQKDPTLRQPKPYYTEPELEGTLVAVNEYSRTYQTGTNTYTTQIGGESNTYQDENGDLQLVDNTLVEQTPWFSTDYFKNTANDYTVKLPTKITSKNGIKLLKNGYTIELIPQGGDFSKPVVVDNAVLYNDVYDGVDYQYTVLGDTIKEDIVLNKAVDRSKFSFAIMPGKLKLAEKDGIIIAYADDTENPIFTIVAPEMTDASGLFSTNIKLSLDGNIATIIADAEWLNAPERAYPVRIDPTINVSSTDFGMFGVEQGAPNTVIGDNNYPYCGYDDGITSRNIQLYNTLHMMTRTYVNVDYDFSQIPTEAKIDNATLSVYHYTSWSKGNTNFGLYTVDQPWSPNSLTWNSQKDFLHTFIEFQPSNNTAGWLTWNIKDAIIDWVQNPSNNNGFVIKAEDERNMQCEVFHNKNGTNKPSLTISWSIPDPVDPNYPLNDLSVSLRPITEKNVNGKLLFDAVFADGVATPGATVKYWLAPNNTTGYAQASASYKFPDSTAFATVFPNGTSYKDKLSNWQTQLFGGLSFDKAYRVSATATLNGQTSTQADSEKFLIYKIKRTDTFPYIANYYGVPLNTIMRDNRVQDTLVVENNTIFIRNPKTEVAYNPAPLTDDAKKAIDSALMGRGLHCEYGFEPINLNTGNFYFNAVDATIADLGGDFSIERTYNSKADGTNSLFGRNWNFVYSENLSECANGKIAYSTGDGKTLYFAPNGSGGYISPSGYHYTLNKIAYTVGEDTYYRFELLETDGSRKEFNAWGLLSKITDQNGFSTSIQYDEYYNITSITSPTGKVYGITCTDGKITSILLPNGAVLRYTYNTNGDLTEYTDANGNTLRYVYDSKHRMTEWYNQEGTRIVLNKYDASGRVTKQTDANGAITSLYYSDNKTVTTDANGNVTAYTYDDLYRTTKIEYPDGKVETRTYDADNNLVSDADYIYTYDTNGNKLSETRADSATRIYTYNSRNQVTSVTDFDGSKTVMEYSAAGDLIKLTYADGKLETYTYDSQHRILTHTDANGNTEHYSYEGAVANTYTDYNGNTYQFFYNSINQLITIIAPDGTTSRKMYNLAGIQIGEQAADGSHTEYSLNKVGNVVRITDPMGYASDFEYDGMYNIVKGIDPQNNTVTYTYDGNGNQTSETDAKGNTTTYEYDSRNRLVKQISPNGSIVTYAYDTNGNLLSKTDANANKTVSEYDSVLKLPIKTTDPLGNITNFSYTVTGKPQKITYADGTFIAYEYDLRGRMTKFIDQTGLVSEFTYDGNGNIIKLTENGIRTYTYEYDANNNLIKTIDPLGGVVSYTYNALNRQVNMTNALGNKTAYEYDAVGRVTKTIDAANNAVSVAYDKNGNTICVTDAGGGITQYVYDAVNNPISSKNAEGNITNYAFNSLQQLSSITDALNGKTTYEYDSNGNIISVTDANGHISSIEYDQNGNAVKITLPNGDKSIFEYDALSRVIKSIDAAGLEKIYTYDSMGRVIEVSDNTGAKIVYEYDKLGRLISQTDVAGRSEHYEYDDFSQITSVIGTDGNKTLFSYDALGRLVSYTDAESKTTTFTYDLLGNLLIKTESDGATYRYAYDKLNQLTESIDPLGASTTYSYDKNGNLTAVTDGNGVTNTYAYDKLNNLSSYVDGNGNTTAYKYDELSRLIALTEPEGSKTEYRYDAVGNATKIKDANGYITEFVFDSVGNVVKAISQRGAEISYTHNKHNVLTSVTDALDNTTAYDVDLNGLVTKITQSNGGEYNYTYDKVNRITGITTPNGYEKTFEYDEFGNLTTEKDNLDCITHYEYDIMHRVIKVTDPSGVGTVYSYDSGGNLSSVLEANGAKTSYVYDLLDRVTQQTDPEGKVTQLQYDLVGNVTSVTEHGGRTTTLSYDKNYNLTALTDPLGFVSEQSYDKNNRVTSTTNALGNSVQYEYDPLGQVTKVTDAAGAVVKYAYDAHGNITKVTNQLGGETVYTYDLADNLIKVTDPLQRESNYSYDSMGNLTGITDADGKKTAYTYDLEGNMTSLTDENGSKESMSYDLASNLKSIVRPDNTTVTYDYDKLNRLVSKTYSQDDSNVLYLYDQIGNRIGMTDETGESTYTYDIMNRITSVTAADGKTVKYSYDDCGRLDSITYADERVVYYTYDLNDRLICVTDGDRVTNYIYDAIGRVIKTTRSDKSYTTYTYDIRGNLTELINTGSDGSVVSCFAYTYNQQGYITKEIATDTHGEVTRTYAYNPSGELAQFTEYDGIKTIKYDYTYDNSGNRTSLKKSGIDHPETITYTYNAANQLVSEKSTINGTTHYTYDANGNLISEQTGKQKQVTYEYTVEQRLSAVREGGELLMAASYDGDGNRVFQISRKQAEHYVVKGDLSYGKDNQNKQYAENNSNPAHTPNSGATTTNPQNDSSALPDTNTNSQLVNTYYEKIYVDPADTIFWYGFSQSILQFLANVNTALSAYLSDWFCHAWDYVTGQYELVLHSEAVATSYSADDVQNMRNAGLCEKDIAGIIGSELDFDGNAMVKYIDTTASADNKSESINGKPTEKPSSGDAIVIPANPDDTTRIDYELTYYVNNVNTQHTQVLMEYGKRDELKNVYTYGNQRISAESIAPTTNTLTDDYATDYYLYDGRGSVAQVVSADQIVAQYTYDPFGNVTSGAPAFDSFYGYNAEDTNPVTGLQYLRARYYNTDSGRFNVADTYLGDISNPLTLNRYSYGINNPIIYIDPSGHFILTALLVGAAVGAAVGGISSAVKQKQSTGKIDGWKVARDALIGGVVGGIAGTVGAAVATVTAAAVGTTTITGAVSLTLSQSIGVGMVSSVAAGTTSRYVSSTLNNTFAPEKPKTNPVQEAFNPTAILTDVFFGGITGGVTHWATGGIYQTKASIQRQKEIAAQHKQNYCGGEAEKLRAADPVDEVTPKVPDITDDVFNQADDILNNVDDAVNNSSSNNIERSKNTGNPIIDKMQNRVPNNEISPPSKRGNAPISNKDGKPIEIHHRNQEPLGPFDEMHISDHRYGENYKNNHPYYNTQSKVNRTQFRKWQREYWAQEWDNGRWND